jgi:hypothetical protein
MSSPSYDKSIRFAVEESFLLVIISAKFSGKPMSLLKLIVTRPLSEIFAVVLRGKIIISS